VRRETVLEGECNGNTGGQLRHTYMKVLRLVVETKSMILASVMKTISLTQLLSTCMDASRKGCEVRNIE
jgi:hypothetical protein